MDVSNYASALHLDNLQKGTDSFELRLWRWPILGDVNTVTTLKYADSRWQLFETSYYRHFENDNPLKLIIDSSFYVRLPIADSFELISKLSAINISSLPEQKDISGFDDYVSDGAYYLLEYATKGFYKTLSYHNPANYPDSQNIRFAKLVRLLRKPLK